MNGGEPLRFEYRRRTFDGTLAEFDEFLRGEYGDELVDSTGDIEHSLETNTRIDAVYELEDARIEIDDDGTSPEDFVNFRIYSDDQTVATRIRDTVLSKGDGEFDRTYRDGILYDGPVTPPQRSNEYTTLEPFIDIEQVLADHYTDAEITVRPIDDDLDARNNKITPEYADDGSTYLAEASIDVVPDGAEDPVTIHVTQQKSSSSADIKFIAESMDTALIDDAYRLIHGRYLALPEAQDGPEPFDEFVTDTDVGLDDVGGLSELKERVVQDIIHPLKHREEAAAMGISPTNGAIFYGLPGTGKTLLAQAIAGETDATFYNIEMDKIMSKYVGETEETLLGLFDHAERNAPAVVFFDEADTAIPDRDHSEKEYTQSMTNTILKLLDGFEEADDIVAIAATNRLEGLDTAGQRSGRFDDMYEVPPPDRDGREEILSLYMDAKTDTAQHDDLFSGVDVAELVRRSAGATGADLEVWVDKAVRAAAYRDGYNPDTPPQVTAVGTEDFIDTADRMPFADAEGSPISRIIDTLQAGPLP